MKSLLIPDFPHLEYRFPAVQTASCLLWLLIGLALFTCGSAAATQLSPLPKNTEYEPIRARWAEAGRDELQRAAEAGVADAQFYLGWTEIQAANRTNSQAWARYFQSPDSPKDLSEAETANRLLRWQGKAEADIRQAAERHEPGAGKALYDLESDRSLAWARRGFEWIKRAAEQGLCIAEVDVARRYLDLSGWVVVKPDEAEGMKWLQRAADKDSEWARHRLADFHFSGRAGPPDLGQGLLWLRRCVDRNCPRAQYELAMYYANGHGEPRGPEESPLALFKKSAAAKHNHALKALADRYRAGFGVEKDFIAAIRYYHDAMAADATLKSWDHSKAGDILGLLDDKLEPKPYPQATMVRFARVLGLYLKATQQRDAAALNAIADMYLLGRDVPQNSVEAYQWFSRAADRGYAGAVATRDELKTTLSREELERAERELRKGPASGSPTP